MAISVNTRFGFSPTFPLISGENVQDNLLEVREVSPGSGVITKGDGTSATGNTPVGLLWKITRTRLGVVQVMTFVWEVNALSSSGYSLLSYSDWT